jgi:hypothetical protein
LKAKKEEPTLEAPKDQLPYTTGKWGSYTQYACKFCVWDTLESEQAIMQHYQERHAPKAEPAKPALIQVYDRYGNPV